MQRKEHAQKLPKAVEQNPQVLGGHTLSNKYMHNVRLNYIMSMVIKLVFQPVQHSKIK